MDIQALDRIRLDPEPAHDEHLLAFHIAVLLNFPADMVPNMGSGHAAAVQGLAHLAVDLIPRPTYVLLQIATEWPE
jgi:hypothetical protein